MLKSTNKLVSYMANMAQHCATSPIGTNVAYLKLKLHLYCLQLPFNRRVLQLNGNRDYFFQVTLAGKEKVTYTPLPIRNGECEAEYWRSCFTKSRHTTQWSCPLIYCVAFINDYGVSKTKQNSILNVLKNKILGWAKSIIHVNNILKVVKYFAKYTNDVYFLEIVKVVIIPVLEWPEIYIVLPWQMIMVC